MLAVNDNEFNLFASVLNMEDMWCREKWRKKDRPKDLYPDASSKDVHIHPELLVPKCDCDQTGMS